MKKQILDEVTLHQVRDKGLFSLANIFLFILLLTSCDKQNEKELKNTDIPTSTPTISLHSTNQISLPTTTIVEATSTQMYPSLIDAIPINITQMPAQISAVNPNEKEYLYHNAKVELESDSSNGMVFLNLDDIRNNSPENSDFLVYIDTGSIGTTLEIYPTNYGRYYYSGKKTMDYNTCLEIFPKTSIEESLQYEEHPPAPVLLGTGNAYCILTNEGRLAVINLIIPSNLNFYNSDGDLSLSLEVTVFTKIVTELFNPAPTKTIGPTPTPSNRYSGRGITDPSQIQMLDESIQAFIDAVKDGDKLTVAKMILYPISIKLITTGEIIELKNQSDFILNYDRIFPEVYKSEITDVILENNVHSYPGIISLECKSVEIDFADNGKIKYIYQLSF